MRELPRVAPPADGLRLAMASARRRRLRTASATTTTTAAALSVALLALGSPPTQTLIQQPAPERPAVRGVVEEPAPAQTPYPQVLSAPGSARVVLASPAGAPPASPAERSFGVTGGGQAQGDGPRYVAGPLKRDDNYLTVPRCTVPASTDEAMSLCTATSVYDSGDRRVELSAEVCSTRTTPTTLHFPGRNEVDFAVVRLGDEHWRWSAWHPDGGAPHTLVLETGACTSWTFLWTVVDAQGKPLPRGSYRLRTTFLADELAEQRVVTTSFDVS